MPSSQFKPVVYAFEVDDAYRTARGGKLLAAISLIFWVIVAALTREFAFVVVGLIGSAVATWASLHQLSRRLATRFTLFDSAIELRLGRRLPTRVPDDRLQQIELLGKDNYVLWYENGKTLSIPNDLPKRDDLVRQLEFRIFTNRKRSNESFKPDTPPIRLDSISAAGTADSNVATTTDKARYRLLGPQPDPNEVFAGDPTKVKWQLTALGAVTLTPVAMLAIRAMLAQQSAAAATVGGLATLFMLTLRAVHQRAVHHRIIFREDGVELYAWGRRPVFVPDRELLQVEPAFFLGDTWTLWYGNWRRFTIDGTLIPNHLALLTRLRNRIEANDPALAVPVTATP
jgi:hypothetical protein